MKKLAIITTHPIQYNAPFFKMLAQRNKVDVKVFYTWSQTEGEIKYDPGFGKNITWDIPLLEGYNYSFSRNTASIPTSASFNGIVNPDLINEIKNWNPNAILVYGWSFNSHLKVLFHFKNKIPILFRGDSTLLDKQSFVKSVLRKVFLKVVYRNINYALYAGEANKNYFLAHGVSKKQLYFMPHAIDNKRFKSTSDSNLKAIELRNKIGIAKDDLLFLFVGKLEPKKQPMLLLNEFKKINTNNHLLFVGSGILENELKSSAESFANIHFLGFQNQSEMPDFYAACDVFVLPSSGPEETWGLAINEAMATGKAILASDACGAVYNLVNDNGFIFKRNDNFDLLLNLKSFNSKNVKQLGNNSLKIITDYSFEKQCEVIEKIMNEN